MNTPATEAQKTFIKSLIDQRINECDDRDEYALEIELLTYVTEHMDMINKASASSLISELKLTFGLHLIENVITRSVPEIIDAFAAEIDNIMLAVQAYTGTVNNENSDGFFDDMYTPEKIVSGEAAHKAGWRVAKTQRKTNATDTSDIPANAITARSVFAGALENKPVVRWIYLYRVTK